MERDCLSCGKSTLELIDGEMHGRRCKNFYACLYHAKEQWVPREARSASDFDLAPCRCGGEVKLGGDAGHACVYCEKCGTSVGGMKRGQSCGDFPNYEQAVRAWNLIHGRRK